MTIVPGGWKRQLLFFVAGMPFVVAGMLMLDYSNTTLFAWEFWGVVSLIFSGRIMGKGDTPS